MGLFSSKIKIYTSASVWNLAGDLSGRPNFLKAAIFKHIVGKNSGVSLGKSLIGSLSNGTVLGDRRFFRYNFGDYPFRIEQAELRRDIAVDAAAIYPKIRADLGLTETQQLKVIAAEIDHADLRFFVEAWLYVNQPATLAEDWEGKFDEGTSEVFVTVGGVEQARFAAPADLLWVQQSGDHRLLYASYQVASLDPVTHLYVNGIPALYTYRMGSGYVPLDALASDVVPLSDFFPVIPLRMEKKYINDPAYVDLYPDVRKAYRSLTGSNIDKLIEQIDQNEDVGKNVDAIYLVKGINLNTEDKLAKEYAFRFFDWLAGIAGSDPWVQDQHTASEVDVLSQNWRDNSSLANTTSALDYGNILADVQTVSAEQPKRTELTIRSVTAERFQYKISWTAIYKEVKQGNFQRWIDPASGAEAKVNDTAIVTKTVTGSEAIRTIVTSRDTLERVYSDVTYELLELYKQTGKHSFSKLTVLNPKHYNYIYKSHAVLTTMDIALDPNEEPESTGFILPLHMPTWQSFSLVQRSQLSYASSYLVFNSYLAVKVRWYQRGIFKVILVVAAVALSIITAGASLGSSVGILGANAAVGISLGASAASAAIVGAIANYMAAIIVTQLISLGATAIFGERIGAVIGAIVSFVALTYAGHYAKFGNFSVDWASILDVRNIMGLTRAVTEGYAKWLAADTAGIYQDIESMSEKYKEKFDEIREKSLEILGETSGEVDPMILTDTTEYFEESPQSFLSRTLLTGSEISALSHALISEFASISLELPGPPQAA